MRIQLLDGIRIATKDAPPSLSHNEKVAQYIESRFVPLSELPPLRGSMLEVERAEQVRLEVLFSMARHRKAVSAEQELLSAICGHTDAKWWNDAWRVFGSASGIHRLLQMEAAHRANAQTEPANRDQGVSATPSSHDIVFLVDAENVCIHHPFVKSILWTRGVNVVAFVSEFVNVDRDSLRKRAKASLEFVECEHTGKNALDFQLVAFAAQKLADNPNMCIRIISKDTGYDSAVAMLAQQGYDVERYAPPTQDKPQSNENRKPEASPPSSTTKGQNVPQSKNADAKEQIRNKAKKMLVWNGYKDSERDTLIAIIIAYARGDYDGMSYSTSICTAMGHLMKNGMRYQQIYAAEKKNIHELLSYAKELTAAPVKKAS